MSQQHPSLRPPLNDEISALCALDKAARSRYAALPQLIGAAVAPPITADRFAAGDTVVAELDRRLVGYVLMQPLDGKLYVASIAVAPDLSGRGIGAALLRAVDDRAIDARIPALTLCTFRSPRWNGPWFRRHGYTPIPQEEIGPGLQAAIDRHAIFLDMSTRETLWKRVPLDSSNPGQ